MTKKKINFRPASEIRTTIEQEIDQWVKTGASSTPSAVTQEVNVVDNVNIEPSGDKHQKAPLYRLSLDIPKFLHKRIKRSCAAEGISMKERLTEILSNAFPEK